MKQINETFNIKLSERKSDVSDDVVIVKTDVNTGVTDVRVTGVTGVYTGVVSVMQIFWLLLLLLSLSLSLC